MQNNNNNQKIKKPYIGMLVISLLLIIGIWLFVSKVVNKRDQLTLDIFTDYVKNDKVLSAVATPYGGVNDFYEIVGEYVDGLPMPFSSSSLISVASL